MSELRRENWLSRLCGGGLLLIACLACAILLGLNTFYTVVIADGYNEQVTIIPGVVRGLTLLALTVLLTIGAAFLPKKEMLREETCFWALCGVYTVMALYLMLNSDSALRDDAELVYSAAQDFLQGDYSAFEKGGYISYYPHQTGLMVYDALIYGLCKETMIGVIANFCFVLGIQYLLWRTTNAMFHNSAVNLAAIGLSFAFLP